MGNRDIIYRIGAECDVEGIRLATRSSIEGIASRDYSKEIIENWGIGSQGAIERHRKSIREGEELTWVAEMEGKVVGFSALAPEREELRAVYVVKEVERQGVGTKLLLLLESKAIELGLEKLEMHSSITARPFYQKFGYVDLGEGIHTLSSGVKMKCHHMKKALRPPKK